MKPATCVACLFCKRLMHVGTCSVNSQKTIGGTIYNSIPYGDDAEGWKKLKMAPPVRCHTCGVRIGGYHHPGCDLDTCPVCGGQAMLCNYETDEHVMPIRHRHHERKTDV